jgi:ribosomal protein L7/L12
MAEAESPAGEGVYRALLIGNSTFPDDPHNLFELKGPVNDLPLLRAAITDPEVGLFDDANVRLLPERSKREITTAIEDFFTSAAPADTVLLYYTGHGMTNEYDNLFLCARDTRTDRLVSTGISDVEVDAMMRSSSARRFVVILDCCYSGAFKSGGLMPAKLKGSGRFLLTSSRGSEPSGDAVRQHETSAFTRHLVEGLRVAIDHNGDGYVSVNEIYDHVHDKLHVETKQIPQRHFGEAVGDVALARRLRETRVAAAPLAASDERPKLSVSPEAIQLRDVGPEEELPVEIIDVFNDGGGELDWTASSNVPWISIVEHDTYCELTLKPRAGVNRGAVRIRDAGRGGSRTVRLLVEVLDDQAAPQLEVTPSELDFGALSVGAECPPRTLLIHETRKGATPARALATTPQIRVDQLEDVITVRIDTANAGEVTGEVVVRGDNGVAIVPVRADVEPGPILEVDPCLVDFGAVTEGEEPTATIAIANRGSGRLTWKHGRSGDFFTAKRKGDELILRLVGRPGSHVGSVFVQGAGGETAVDVRAEISPKRADRPKPAEGQERFDVILTSAGDKRIEVIKHVRALTGLGLTEAKDLVDATPTPVIAGVAASKAQAAADSLAKAGADVRIATASATAPRSRPEPGRFDIVLTNAGEDRIQVIKLLRAETSLGVKQVKDLVDAAPSPVITGLAESDARAAADRLRQAGASVSIESSPPTSAGRSAGPPGSRRHDVVLLPGGAKAGRKSNTVTVVRDVTGLSKNKASRLVDSAPATLRTALHQAEAEFVVKQLAKVGAKAEVRASESRSTSGTASLFRLASQKLRESGAYPLQAVSLGFSLADPGDEVPEPVERIKLHLVALSSRLDVDEKVHNLALGSLDWNDGIVAVSDRRLIFIRRDSVGFHTTDIRFDEVTGITEAFTLSSGKLQISMTAPVVGKAISKILPSARKSEILNYVRRKIPASNP